MTADLDGVRRSVLDEVDRANRARVLAIGAAALAEAVLLSAAVWLIDWADRTQVVLFVLFVLTYVTLGLGLIALGTHVSRSTARVVAAVAAAGESRGE